MNRSLNPEAALEQEIINYLSNHGYLYIKPSDIKNSFNKEYAIDQDRLFSFIETTQPNVFNVLNLADQSARSKFLYNLDKAIKKDGIISVLKNGIKIYQVSSNVILFYHLLDEKDPDTKIKFEQNIFSVSNQLTYSDKNKQLELDLCIFINGLPIITIELKSRSSSTNWSYVDAMEQYKNDRSNLDTLFSFKRCIVHFAMDENDIAFSTKIDGDKTFFMPFNKGKDNGAGNPISNDGYMTDYLWKEILDKKNLTSLIKDFCYVLKDEKNNEKLIFPRYHQWRVVTKLVKDAYENKVGNKYLIQHSAGSGKSNSITWLSYKLVGLEKDKKPIFDSVVVITDRNNLDQQISNNLDQFGHLRTIFAHANDSNELAKFLNDGKKIIATTIQKFPYILDKDTSDLANKNFAIIIDEAHSSQAGEYSKNSNIAISGAINPNNDTEEPELDDYIYNFIKAQKMPKNASFFAFTATPKAETLTLFGEKVFDLYSMKQAIQERFILDVLKNYTTYNNYYKIIKTIKENPKLDALRTNIELKAYTHGHEVPIKEKSKIIVDHFITNVSWKIGNKAKAMVVTKNIDTAYKYHTNISKLLKEKRTNYEALIAFSGEWEDSGVKRTEANINGFSDYLTAKKFKEDKYRFLVVADKYQTGYDEPLLNAMYVDKKLSGVRAVQTLSRLNRCFKGKDDTFVLDFYNDVDEIKKAFQPYYSETLLIDELDPNKMYKLLSDLDNKQIYTDKDIELVVNWYKKRNMELKEINPTLDTCVDLFNKLSEDNQDKFKIGIKQFIKEYNFLANIIETPKEWTKKYFFFNQLVKRLPKSKKDNLSIPIPEIISLQNYRLEENDQTHIVLEDKQSEISLNYKYYDYKIQPVTDTLDNLVSYFNDFFGDNDTVYQHIYELQSNLYKQATLRNAILNSDRENIMLELEKVLKKELNNGDPELFRKYIKNEERFKDRLSSWLLDVLIQQYKPS
ncbi:DEAD/DEAH box helicase [Ureaplasma diversum]|uniref:DEAD/DEAH box helicase n=1 Tax=Ureaplasma diversum TaxID=42094 RepID=A0A0C5S202_9BACT|nr:type I restriction endonuclease [Ureaplasma diversum]AJQ45395.1 DEAD/DEAH box helicase [Ureaplasma diversum]